VSRLLSLLVRGIGGLVLAALGLGFLYALLLVFRAVTHVDPDDAEHVEAKNRYLASVAEETQATQDARPNILLVLFDDLGHGDLGAYGAGSIATPHIDRLASEGLRLDDYYAPSPVCTSSRVGLLTGRYPNRALLNIVAFPTGSPVHFIMRALGTPSTRLVEEEILLPEILSAAGYETGMVGKWHLGDRAPSRPVDRGFDTYLGALWSNDMTPFAIYEGDQVVHQAPFDQTRMKRVYEDAAVEFLDREHDRPFFLYFAHNFPHIPLYAPDEDLDRSDAGLYGDVVEGLDDSVGRMIEVLERRGVLDDTIVIITSDNGPWYEGSAGLARGRKNQTWEGGMRVPFIVRWPSRVSSGITSDAPIVGVDLVPTLLGLLDLPAPPDRILDGADVGAHLFDAAPAEDRLVYYYATSQGGSGGLDAVRDARFKYHRRRGVRAGGTERLSANADHGPWLFDLDQDPNESWDVSRRYPEEMARLAAAFEARVTEDRENLRGWR